MPHAKVGMRIQGPKKLIHIVAFVLDTQYRHKDGGLSYDPVQTITTRCRKVIQNDWRGKGKLTKKKANCLACLGS